MASGTKNDILLVIRAVDRVTKPVKLIREKIENAFRPLKVLGKVIDRNLDLKGVAEKWGGVKKAAGRVGSEVSALAAKMAGLALAGGAAFYGIVHGAMKAGDRLAEVASRVGLGVNAFASLEYSAGQADVSNEMFAASMDKLNKQLGDMTVGKGGEFLAFLNEISPTFAKQMKGAKSTEAAIALLTDAMAKIEDPQRRATLAAHAFGKGNLQMAEWLHQGSAAIQGQQRHFMDLVGSQEESAKAASDLDNAAKDLQRAFFGAQNSIGGTFFPVLTELANKVTGFLSDNRASLAAWADKAAAAFKGWIDSGGFERLIASLGEIASSIGKVVAWLGPMGTAFTVAAIALAPLLASVVSLGGALISFAVSTAPLVVGAWGAIIPLLGTAATAFWGVATGIGAAMLPLLPFIAAAGALVYLGKTIYDNWADLTLIFKEWGSTIRSLFGGGSSKVTVATEAAAAAPSAASALGPAANAAPRVSSAPAASGESTVNVNFSNLPRGARVSSPDGDAPVSISAGYSMVTP